MAKVLIAEDDALIAITLEMGLSMGGYEICGVVPTVAKGIELAERHQPDLAVIDLRLANHDDGRELAVALNRSRRVGIVFATGNLDLDQLAGGPGDICLQKPYRPADVVEALRAVERMIQTGELPARLPEGLHLIDKIPRRDNGNKLSRG
ncbi:MAG TPA: response regulator [Aliidongia sp.]|nr:response regulator [Aliidongia sp.]